MPKHLHGSQVLLSDSGKKFVGLKSPDGTEHSLQLKYDSLSAFYADIAAKEIGVGTFQVAL